MKAVIVRHAEVDFGWSRQCSSADYDSDCSGYDSAPIKEKEYKIPQLGYQRIYISELSRSRATAELLFPGRDYTESGLINEVPLRSCFDSEKKFPLWFWNIFGRLQWLFNSSRQAEKRDETKERARQFIAMVSEENMDCVLITHGFFMHTLLQEMKKAGFKTGKASAEYKNGEYIIAEKDQELSK
jgi:broad specificity phosphatase PhoE